VTFGFVLNTFYRQGIVEHDRAISALYDVEIVMDNKLQSGFVSVDLRMDRQLKRSCKSTLRGVTILDVFVLVFAIVISNLYIISVLRQKKFLKVCITTMYKCLLVCTKTVSCTLFVFYST